MPRPPSGRRRVALYHVIARVSRVACIAKWPDAQPSVPPRGNRVATCAPAKLITRLDRYIFRQLLFALVAVTGGLTALVWLIQSLRFVELVVNHGLSLVVFVQLTGLLIPSFIAVILPITTFVVVQFIYQRLAATARSR